MERHDTHALSYSSSSYNHSYEFDNLKNNKKNKRVISRNIKDRLNEGQLTSIQIKKINSILRKYNINSDQSQKSEGLFKYSQKTDNKEEELNLNKNVLSTKNNVGENNHTLSNKNKKREKKEKKKKKDKIKKDINNNDNHVEESKKEEIEEIKKELTIDEFKVGDKKENFKFGISYRNYIRDTRFNNIQKNIDDEKKRKNKKQEKKK